ncbi:MAG: DUF2012 domain-containing protein, partial [Acidobacteria bacterium]|nr:DUF2012 domain-containing protein [Acidobacteriota bacterium]
GLTKARVVLTDAVGNTRSALTNPVGYFRFDDVQAGETYILSVSSKRYRFSPRVVNVTDELADIDFMPEP